MAEVSQCRLDVKLFQSFDTVECFSLGIDVNRGQEQDGENNKYVYQDLHHEEVRLDTMSKDVKWVFIKSMSLRSIISLLLLLMLIA